MARTNVAFADNADANTDMNASAHAASPAPLTVAEFPIAATGEDEDARKKNVTTAELSFPRKHFAGQPKTEQEAAQLDALELRVFTGNYRSYVVRAGKSYTPEEIVSAWNEYRLGAPRERTGETLRHKAAYIFVQAWLEAKNAEREASGLKPLPWPRAKKGVMTETEAEAKREAMIQRVLTSDNAATQARIAEIEAELRAAQQAARGRADSAGVDELESAMDF